MSPIINACLEAAKKANAPMIIQFSNGGGQFLAGKGLKNEADQKAAVMGCVAGALQVRMRPPSRAPAPLAFSHPTPYTLHPTPYTLHPTPYTLHPTPYTLHPTPHTLHPAAHIPIPHPTPYISNFQKPRTSNPTLSSHGRSPGATASLNLQPYAVLYTLRPDLPNPNP
jgi:hypothetical protein